MTLGGLLIKTCQKHDSMIDRSWQGTLVRRHQRLRLAKRGCTFWPVALGG
jgi:hypothetical protein